MGHAFESEDLPAKYTVAVLQPRGLQFSRDELRLVHKGLMTLAGGCWVNRLGMFARPLFASFC